MVIAPNGDVLPCQAAATIPGLGVGNVRERSLSGIWFESEAFQRFRGAGWMREPCRSCPLGRQEIDFGGCRCQALALTGDAAATDPVCHLSPNHHLVVDTREGADQAGVPSDVAAIGPLVYRATRQRAPVMP